MFVVLFFYFQFGLSNVYGKKKYEEKIEKLKTNLVTFDDHAGFETKSYLFSQNYIDSCLSITKNHIKSQNYDKAELVVEKLIGNYINDECIADFFTFSYMDSSNTRPDIVNFNISFLSNAHKVFNYYSFIKGIKGDYNSAEAMTELIGGLVYRFSFYNDKWYEITKGFVAEFENYFINNKTIKKNDVDNILTSLYFLAYSSSIYLFNENSLELTAEYVDKAKSNTTKGILDYSCELYFNCRNEQNDLKYSNRDHTVSFNTAHFFYRTNYLDHSLLFFSPYRTITTSNFPVSNDYVLNGVRRYFNFFDSEFHDDPPVELQYLKELYKDTYGLLLKNEDYLLSFLDSIGELNLDQFDVYSSLSSQNINKLKKNPTFTDSIISLDNNSTFTDEVGEQVEIEIDDKSIRGTGLLINKISFFKIIHKHKLKILPEVYFDSYSTIPYYMNFHLDAFIVSLNPLVIKYDYSFTLFPGKKKSALVLYKWNDKKLIYEPDYSTLNITPAQLMLLSSPSDEILFLYANYSKIKKILKSNDEAKRLLVLNLIWEIIEYKKRILGGVNNE